jgi:hypothetical protein
VQRTGDKRCSEQRCDSCAQDGGEKEFHGVYWFDSCRNVESDLSRGVFVQKVKSTIAREQSVKKCKYYAGRNLRQRSADPHATLLTSDISAE